MRIAKEVGIPDIQDRLFTDVQIMLEMLDEKQSKPQTKGQNLLGTMLSFANRLKGQ
jgi:hypothetical protein